MKRRLAAILVADVAGYSGLMEADEERTAARMANCRGIAEAEITKTDGRIFKTMGDAVLAEFASPINALRAAVGIRDVLAAADQGNDPPLAMRFGLHLADVLVEGDDLIGDGVNLAARIQQAAEPGAIDLSAAFFEQIRRTSPYAFDDRGEQTFRNITEPMRVYRLRGEMRRHPYQITHAQSGRNLAKRPHSLAVMPFEVSAGDKDRQFLAEGIAEELIFELGRFRKLFVTSRTATRALDGKEVDPQSLGDRLGVRYVLTGTIRQLGPCVRLSLMLTETDTGTVVWSDRLSEPLNELVDRLDKLVSHIASTVLGRIQESDIAAARRLKPESMTAYEFHLRGLEFHRLGGVTDDNIRQAMQWFERAIEADPNFARPRAMLTCAWSNLSTFDLAEGARHVERALELDPNEPEANRIMGSIKMGANEFEASRHYHEKAMALSPSDAYIKGRSAAFYIFCGEPERALQLLDQAEELDPFLPVWCIEERVAALYALDRFEEAADAGRALPFQTRRSRLYRAASRVALGHVDRARRILAEALAANPDLTADYIRQRECYRDPTVKTLLIERLARAGLPQRSATTNALRPPEIQCPGEENQGADGSTRCAARPE
jgi:class 3 adenylate cyclase/TolB-like protein